MTTHKCETCGGPFEAKPHRTRARFCSYACRREGKRPSRCAACDMAGHGAATCHVTARGAREPDAADLVAQELVPPGAVMPHNLGLGDLRRAIAAALRAARGAAA